MNTLLVFSHLRWNFVYQRPQHLLARLAAHYRVLFVEEPMQGGGAAHLESVGAAPGVEVLRPHTPLGMPGFHDEQLACIGPLLDEALAARGVDECLVWFYTPMALPLLARVPARLVVYDCMDELSAFLGAPPALHEREAELLRIADLVLTGGPSLYEAKRGRNERVLCVPSSVDAAHFARAQESRDGRPAREHERASTGLEAAPRLGYYGVIDERMDLALVARLADAEPTWQIDMVGPVVKIDAAALPQRANLHWLGQRAYDELPGVVAGWDVCLMPFALNEATRFISPTKTLEYMAAGKPVASTAVRDVATLYGEVVEIGADGDGFIDACRRLLAESGAERAARKSAMASAVARHSWDRTAARVVDAIESARAASATASQGTKETIAAAANDGGARAREPRTATSASAMASR